MNPNRMTCAKLYSAGIGAAYGTAKAGIGISGVGTFRSDLIMKVSIFSDTSLSRTLTSLKSLIPVVMSGIIAVYALVIAVLIAGDMAPPPEKNYSLFGGFMHLASGLSVGATGLAAGYAIGIVGDSVCSWDTFQIFGRGVTVLGRASLHATIEDFRGHGTHSHFRGSLGSLWVGLLISVLRLVTHKHADSLSH